MALDPNAWFVTEGTILGSWNSGSPSSGPFGGTSASQLSIVGSNVVNQIIYNGSNFTFPGGAGQGGPITVPLKSSTFMWNKMELLYGTIAVRAKLTGVNTHPTIWMLSSPARQTVWQVNPTVQSWAFLNNLNWVNEIDIAEGVPAVTSNTTTLRQNLFSSGTGSGGVMNTTTVTDYSANFHEYKITWTPTALTWFVDGVQTNQVTTVADIPTGPMFLIIDIETDLGGAGTPSSGNFPQQMQVDYVKAWDQNNNLVFYDEFDGSKVLQKLSSTNLTFIQANAATQVSSVSTITTQYPNASTSGSYLLAFVIADPTSLVVSSITDTLGNTWIPIAHDATNGSWIFQCVANKAGGGADIVTANLSGTTTFGLLGILEYTGQAASPLDVISADLDSTGASYTGTSVVTTQSNETVVGLGFWNGSGTPVGSGTFTVNFTFVAGFFAAGDMPANSIGSSYAPTMTTGNAGSRFIFYSVALKSTSSALPVSNEAALFLLLGAGQG